jgi:hypothetical protein
MNNQKQKSELGRGWYHRELWAAARGTGKAAAAAQGTGEQGTDGFEQ